MSEVASAGVLTHNSLVVTDNAIVFRQASDGRPMEINLEEIAKAEARIQEIQTVTPTKAGELLAAFTVAWRDLDKLVVLLTYQHVVATNRLKEVRARILVDAVPGILKEKGLPSSKDVRDAIVDRDPEAQEAAETVHQIHCILELIKGKREAIGMAFSSVKRIVGEGAYNMLRNTDNPRLKGDSGSRTIEESPPEASPTTPRPVSSRFGSPRY